MNPPQPLRVTTTRKFSPNYTRVHPEEETMAICLNEELLTLRDACAILPRRRRGRRPGIATLYRWSSRGIRGILLETVQMGGTRCTSREALERFFKRLADEPSEESEEKTSKPRTSAERQRAVSEATEKLKRQGF